MDIDHLTHTCKTALQMSRQLLSSLSDGGRSEVHDEHVVDISTQGDRAVSAALAELFAREKIPAVLLSEESGRTELSGSLEYTIAFDDIDGTDNYYRGRGLLPHCTVITIFNSPEPIFADALVAGVIEHNSGQLWHAVRDGGCFLDGTAVTASGRTSLDRRTLLIIDHYISGGAIDRFAPLYDTAWIKDFGASALHLAGVGSGLFDAFLSPAQKSHELGAGYLLVREAEGVLTDWDGASLDDSPFDFDRQTPILAAATRDLSDALLKKL